MPSETPTGEPYTAVFIGNLGLSLHPDADDPRDQDAYLVSDQQVAVKSALEFARKIKDEDGSRVRLFTMLDHPYHSKHRKTEKVDDGKGGMVDKVISDRRIPRQLLIDPVKVPSRDRREEIHWPMANNVIEPVRNVLRGPLSRYGFNLRDLRVLPEASVFWTMHRELTENASLCSYTPASDRRLFAEQPNDFRSPRCVSIFGGAMLLAAARQFVPVLPSAERRAEYKKRGVVEPPPSVSVKPFDAGGQIPLWFFYQLDGDRVSRGAVEEGYNYVTNPGTYALDPARIKLVVSFETTRQHIPPAK